MKTYGTITLNAEGRFEVDAAPHVLLRLKRVFDKVGKTEIRPTFAPTPENCRELEWFAERYPLAMSDEVTHQLTVGASAHRETIQTLDQLIDPNYTPPALPMALPARPYQLVSNEIYLRQGFQLNADDLGLGKTCSAICSLTDPRALPAIVVAYPHLQRQWRDEIKKFMPGLHVHIVTKGTPYELPRVDGRGPDVIVTTYMKLANWVSVLQAYAKSIVFDEAQELRRRDSGKYAAAKLIADAMAFRIGLTATPVYNYGDEIWSLLNVLKDGVLGQFDEFTREWCTSLGQGKYRVKEPVALGSYLREHFVMVRRTRADVGRQLPTVVRVPHSIDADAKVFRSIEGRAAELAEILLNRAEQKAGDKMRAGGDLDKLIRQATGLAKAPYVAGFVELLAQSKRKVVLVGWHHAVYDVWQQQLERSGLSVQRYTGEQSDKQKAEAIAAFRNTSDDGPSADVLILSLRSGVGINGLQEVCDTLVFGELDWSPGVHEQVIGRLQRDGQVGQVTAYFLVSEYGADPTMSEVLGLKTQQVEGLRNPDRPVVEVAAGRDDDGIRRMAQQYLKGRTKISGSKRFANIRHSG